MITLNTSEPHEIFFPHHAKQLGRIKKEEIDFAYYTSALTAYDLIKNQELWLRNITVMNDYMEFDHGKKCLLKLIKETAEGERLKQIFNNLKPNLFDETLLDFEKYAVNMKMDINISCFSEHKCIEEDNGKLSMWRAYGGNNGVAIIFKPELFYWFASIGFDFSSVAYLDEIKLKKEITSLSESISNNLHYVNELSIEELKSILFNIFKFSALCNKHIGFKEEDEWRLIAMNSIHSNHCLVSQEVETKNGTPQIISKIKLSKTLPNDPKLKDMIKKVIIGPCRHPNVIYDSISSALVSIGVESPDRIIYGSDIPFRVNY